MIGSGGVISRSAAGSVLPREIGGVSLGISYGDLKRGLHDLKHRIKREDIGVDPATGIPYHFVVSASPHEEIRTFIYRMYENKLLSIKAEYNTANKMVDFAKMFADLREQYGEPQEVEDLSDALMGTTFVIYHWEDKDTRFELGYGPPGRDPIFKRSDLGSISWEIFDRDLLRSYDLEVERRDPPFRRKKQK